MTFTHVDDEYSDSISMSKADVAGRRGWKLQRSQLTEVLEIADSQSGSHTTTGARVKDIPECGYVDYTDSSSTNSRTLETICKWYGVNGTELEKIRYKSAVR